MDQAAKHEVRDALLVRARESLAAARENLARLDAGARLDQDSAHEIDDQWQADEDGDLGGLFERQRANAQAALKRLEALSFDLTEVAGIGAIIGIDQQRYVVGIVEEPIEVAGISYETISADAPLFAAIEGLRLGEGFSFRGRDQMIDFLA